MAVVIPIASRRVIQPIASSDSAADDSTACDVIKPVGDVTALMTACQAEDEEEVRELLVPAGDIEDLVEFQHRAVSNLRSISRSIYNYYRNNESVCM